MAADTIVPSTINTTTWTKAGGRYIIATRSVVPRGQTLSIEPGVEVVLGPEARLDVNGRIYAIGDRQDPIVFRAASPTAPWSLIWVQNEGSDPDSLFRWCVFSNAATALMLDNYAGNLATQEVSNCVFQDCGNGIQAWARGGRTPTAEDSLDPIIQNSRFLNCSTNGILVVLKSEPHGNPGRASPLIRGNTFQNIAESAIAFAVESGLPSRPQVINNTIVAAHTGLRTGSPYDVTAKNNIFVSCTSAVHRSAVDELNLTVSHNNFYDNTTNFFNYPTAYGLTVWENLNGHPADINLNIFEDPLFADSNTLTLDAASPCIDAGDPTGAFLDNCFPPSQGANVNDLGAYGGPSACGWVDSSSTVFKLEIEQYAGITIHPDSPGLYRLEYAPTVGNTNLWQQITTVNLTTVPWTYIDNEYPRGGNRSYRAVLLE